MATTDNPAPSDVGCPSDAQVRAYIVDQCSDMMALATSPRFQFIRYLLDMARLEAKRSATKPMAREPSKIGSPDLT